MKKIENVEVMGWEAAIRGMPAKGYRKTKSGKFECFVSDHSKKHKSWNVWNRRTC